MYINEQYHDLPLLETKEYRFISRDGQLISKQEQILKEHLIDVYLNDHLTMKLVCLPQYLTELVLGRLLTERIIDSISDIEQIYIAFIYMTVVEYLRFRIFCTVLHQHNFCHYCKTIFAISFATRANSSRSRVSARRFGSIPAASSTSEI